MLDNYYIFNLFLIAVTSTHKDFDHMKSAESIGVTSVIFSSLKYPRKQDFTFKWDAVLQV